MLLGHLKYVLVKKGYVFQSIVIHDKELEVLFVF